MSIDSNLATRREFLQGPSMGLRSLALTWLLHQERVLANPQALLNDQVRHDMRRRPASLPPRAKAMISLFQHGGPSHIDLFDPKPLLNQRDGQDYPGDVEYSFANNASKKLLGTRWKFAPRGACGTELSELLPYTAGMVDEICLLRGMHTGANGHEVSIRYFHGGIPGVVGRPHYASWLLYGLGAETAELPAYVVLTDPGGSPVDGVNNWSHGFLPSMFQSAVLRPKEPRILNLDPPSHLRGEPQKQHLDLLHQLNTHHAQQHPGEADLLARIASYELAAHMQTAAREALDIHQETAATHRLYGIDQEPTREYGTRCLIARRLVERGVRFVQLFLAGQPWDNHSNLGTTLPAICQRIDQPSAALVFDLKQRGLLDETIVHWGGEIGRLPVTQDQGAAAQHGRDHNGQGFSIWLAGGGIRPGITFGATDEFGHKAVENVMTPNDYQATILELFGLDWQGLTYDHNGQKHALTAGRPARVVRDILT